MKRTIQTILWALFALLLPFSLHGDHDAVLAQQFLPEPFAITTPSDGDTWILGERVTIEWRQTDFSVEDHDVKFKLIPKNLDDPERVIREVDSDRTSTTFTLPEYIKPGIYELIMIDAEEDPEFGEILDGWLADDGRIQIIGAHAFVRVQVPKHGDEIRAGRRHTIEWRTEGSAPRLNISLYQSFRHTKSGTIERVATVARNILDTGEFSWVIPDNILRDRDSEGFIYHIYDTRNEFAEQRISLPAHPSAGNDTPSLGDVSGATNWSGYFSIVASDSDGQTNNNDEDNVEGGKDNADDSDDESIVIAPRTAPTLVRAIGNPRVYAIRGGKRLWIPTPEAFERAGLRWNDIVLVTKNELADYPRLSLAKTAGNERIYYLTQGGLKRHIPDTAVFRSYGNSERDVVVVESGILNAITDVQFIHLDGSPNIYRIIGDTKHWVRSRAVFDRIVADNPEIGTQVAPVNTTEFKAHKTGMTIQ